MKVKNMKGFTLAELLVVMAVVVVLASVSLPTFGKYIETSRETADMEIIRSYYDDTLSLAILDAEDGTLDGKIKTDGTNDITISTGSTAIVGSPASGEGATGYTYTVTLASLTPKASFKQAQTGWQYVSSMVGGVIVGAATNASTKIVYTYSLNSTTGEVALDSIAPGT